MKEKGKKDEGKGKEIIIKSVVQSYLTFWDPRDCRLPGSSVHAILQQDFWRR